MNAAKTTAQSVTVTNAQIVERGWDAVARGDWEALLQTTPMT